MLETTLETDYVPGTNVTGRLAFADWRFLLPSLKMDNVLCIETPSVETLAVLATMSNLIIVVSRDESKLRKIRRQAKAWNLDTIFPIQVSGIEDLPLLGHRVQILQFSDGYSGQRMLQNHSVLKEFYRILRRDGTIYSEIQSVIGPFAFKRLLRSLSYHGLSASSCFWLTPLKGDFRTALPLHEGRIARYFFRNVLYGQSLKKRILSKIGSGLSKRGLIGSLSPHRAVAVRHFEADKIRTRVPEYIACIGRQAGLDLSDYRFALSVRGKYNANKVIFFLFRKGSVTPQIVVKMTRSSEFNRRLENEYQVLSELCKTGYAAKGSFPEPIFIGYHNSLALLGLKAVDGEPFRIRTDGTPTCPVARKAIRWICRLGTASAKNRLSSSKEISESLERVFKKFKGIYKLPRNEIQFLWEQIDFIRNRKAQVPLVFQHGDPGTWNILVSERGEVVFIDWEAGELQGIPLWDLFYFMRAHASWVSRVKGRRDFLTNFSEHFLSFSEMSASLIKTAELYCTTIGLDGALVKPLFFTCWMHRALKEATRLTKVQLSQGHYVNLLRLCIERWKSSPLESLFGLNVSSCG